MVNQPFTEKLARALVFVAINALVYWALARWVWPWCGPLWLDPCPLLTPAGTVAAIGFGALAGLTKAIKYELAAARAERRVSHRRERRVCGPIPMRKQP